MINSNLSLNCLFLYFCFHLLSIVSTEDKLPFCRIYFIINKPLQASCNFICRPSPEWIKVICAPFLSRPSLYFRIYIYIYIYIYSSFCFLLIWLLPMAQYVELARCLYIYGFVREVGNFPKNEVIPQCNNAFLIFCLKLMTSQGILLTESLSNC